jgi:CheY-like chemotaxis protein
MNQLKSILLAEDNAKDVELTLEALADHNLANDVVVVNDGADAIDFLLCKGRFKERQPGNPIVILLDIKMPRVDGLEVLHKIRSDESLQYIPVVILTSSREERDVIESYRLGVNAYVVKPVNFTDFVDAVKQLGVFWAAINEPPPSGMQGI